MFVNRKSILSKLTLTIIYLSFCLLASCDKNHLILNQKEIGQETLDTLRSDGIIAQDEQVHYLYTESGVSEDPSLDALLSDEAKTLLETATHDIGVLFTDKQVLSFSSNQTTQELTVTAAIYEEIENISYKSYQFGPNNSMVTVTVSVRDGDNISFTLPDEQDRTQEFFQHLEATWQANPKVAKLSAMVAAGEIPGRNHQYDHSLSTIVKQKLLEANILQANETIALFFTPEPEEFLTQGYFFSDERIVVYRTSAETGELKIQSAQFADVSDIVVENKYEKNADGSYSLLPDTHFQVFTDGDFSFGFDGHDDNADGVISHHAFRLWDKASPVLKNTEKNKSEGVIPPNIIFNGEQLSDSVVQGLIAAQLVKSEDTIYYFAAPHARSYTQFGTIATNRQILDYGISADGDERYLTALDYKDISHIQIQKSDTGGDSRVHIYVNGEYQFSLEAPADNGADDAIYNQIVTQWETLKEDG